MKKLLSLLCFPFMPLIVGKHEDKIKDAHPLTSIEDEDDIDSVVERGRD